jgi:hypothetical protein
MELSKTLKTSLKNVGSKSKEGGEKFKPAKKENRGVIHSYTNLTPSPD